VTGAVMLSSASCGMPVGYSAVLLPQLKQPNETLRIDDEIGSWIGERPPKCNYYVIKPINRSLVFIRAETGSSVS
jgi:hypothetical protein